MVVGGAGALDVGTACASRVDRADRGLFEDLSLHSRHGELFASDAQVVFRSYLEESDLVAPGLPTESGTELDGDRVAAAKSDTPAEIGLHAVSGCEGEDSRPFEEEIALFGEPEGKPSEVHSPLVDFHFRKVGIEGRRGSQAWGDRIPDVEPQVSWVTRRVRQRRLSSPICDNVGLHLETYALGHVREARQASGVDGSPQPLGSPVRRPEDLLLFATYGSLEVDTPCVRLGVEVQGAPRNPDFGRPPIVETLDARLPHAVPGLVDVSSCSEKTVSHQTGWVDFEEVSGPTVQEGIQDPHESVVGTQAFVAAFLVCQDSVRVIEEHRADVECHAIDEDPDLGCLGGLGALDRVLLLELGDGRGRLPSGLAEVTIEVDTLARGYGCGPEDRGFRRRGIVLATVHLLP